MFTVVTKDGRYEMNIYQLMRYITDCHCQSRSYTVYDSEGKIIDRADFDI